MFELFRFILILLTNFILSHMHSTHLAWWINPNCSTWLDHSTRSDYPIHLVYPPQSAWPTWLLQSIRHSLIYLTRLPSARLFQHNCPIQNVCPIGLPDPIVSLWLIGLTDLLGLSSLTNQVQPIIPSWSTWQIHLTWPVQLA